MSETNERSVASGGFVAGEPEVWAVLDSRGTVVAYTSRETAEAYCNGTFNRMAPLYRQPTLTDAERKAVEWCVEMAVLHATDCEGEVAALRGLLERTK